MVSELVTVVVRSPDDYPTFWRMFEKRCAEAKKSLKLYSRQIGEQTWLLIPQKASDAPPPRYLVKEVTFTRWGRYKVYAERLAAGETLRLDYNETIRTKRAWGNYCRGRPRLRSKLTIAEAGDMMILSVERP